MTEMLNGGLFGIAFGAALAGSTVSFFVCLSIAIATTLICRAIRSVTPPGGVRKE